MQIPTHAPIRQSVSTDFEAVSQAFAMPGATYARGLMMISEESGEPLVIEVLRERKRLTQAKVGEHIGVHQAYYSQQVRGKKKMDFDAQVKIAELLGMSSHTYLFQVYDPNKRDVYLKS